MSELLFLVLSSSKVSNFIVKRKELAKLPVPLLLPFVSIIILYLFHIFSLLLFWIFFFLPPKRKLYFIIKNGKCWRGQLQIHDLRIMTCHVETGICLSKRREVFSSFNCPAVP